tara:strand:+ start:695 stop:1480 length:786 start_codon:yes stop_codon:yes gene_type:complete
MVNKAEQPQNDVQDVGNTTTDVTEEFTGVDTPPEGTVEPSAGSTSTETPTVTEESPVADAEETKETPAVGKEETPPPPPAASADGIEERMAEIERQNAAYRAQSQQSQLMQERDIYAQQLEAQGYMPEQASQIADAAVDQYNKQSQIANDAQRYADTVQGRSNASLHYAKQYGLTLEDVSELQTYNSPQSMEAAAKRMRSDRDKDAEIAKLRAQLVPSQNFDDSQSTPAASNDEDRWLERYNQGDRSEQASAAARRAAGLG